jgi:hypothetical protein
MTQNFGFTPDVIIYVPRTEEGETARIRASEMNDDQLRQWCDEISQRDFDEPFSPEKYPWLDGSREGMIDFIVGSYLP